jgi:sugar lactone lactonase YvrE
MLAPGDDTTSDDTLLDTVEVFALPTGSGPEDVAIDADGRVVAGGDDGRVWRWPAGGGQPRMIAETGGRPLGIELDPRDGSLIICDAYRGLLRLRDDGVVVELARTAAGSSIVFCNNASVAADGVVYFSDSSSRYPLWAWKRDFLERQPNGRLLRYDPADGKTTVVADGLYFPNGVALTPDSSAVLVVESTTRALLRVGMGGGIRTLTELPAFPDNMSAVGDGTYWIALPSAREPRTDATPSGSRGPDQQRGVMLVNADGRVLRTLRGPEGRYRMITGVRQHAGSLWLGSLGEPGIGRITLPGAGPASAGPVRAP